MFSLSSLRVFISIAIPASQLKILSDWISVKRGDLRGFRWVSPESMHITLKFCGDISRGQVAHLLTELKNICRIGPFDIYLEGIGGFPNLRRARVFWSAAKGNMERLHALKEEVERAALRASIPRDRKKFTPHVTIARRNFAGSLDRDILDHLVTGGPVTEMWTVSEAAVMSSELSVAGARHSVVGLFKV